MKNELKLLARELSAIEKVEEQKKAKGDKISTTFHTVTIAGNVLKYKAQAGYLKLKDENQKIKSKIFFISYELEGVKDRSQRPVTFAFNGGPGASSAWVHFGCMGPKRLKMTSHGEVLPPPYRFVDNYETWLQFTDLVFIDPIGTGYSIPGEGEKIEQFLGVEEDSQWIGDFIRTFITTYDRWLSPKFIAGESYGTFRAVGLTSYLQTRHAMDLNGIIMISSAVSYQTFDFSPGNDLGYILFLPAYTASAWYHKKLSKELQKDLEKTLEEVEKWTYEKYAPALLKGDALAGKERQSIVNQLAKYTSLPEDYIEHSNLRIRADRFMKMLLRDQRKVVGRYDARLTAMDVDPLSEDIAADPSMFNIYGGCIASLNDFLKKNLKYESELPYRPLSKDVGKLWNWGSGIPGAMGYVNVTDKLIQAISYNQYFKVFFVCGYFDLCTPYSIAKFVRDHLALDETLKKNVSLKTYEGGHMMYVHENSRKKLFEDVKDFVYNSISHLEEE
ncbi:MAG: S10 family peptidase [Vulcanimicrobiota bacterium]